MKCFLAIALSLALMLSLAACALTISSEDGPTVTAADAGEGTATTPTSADDLAENDAEVPEDTAEPVELIVFAAASLQETLTQIGNNYMAANPNISLTFSFDSSGTLKTQIESGADCDIFISAGQKQMDQLDINASSDVNTDGLDFVLADSRKDILENKVTLAVPDGNPAGVESFDQMAEKLAAGDLFLAMGNEDVPVGQYTQKIFDYYGLNEADLASQGLITYGSNVKEVTTQVSEAAVDCGVIYATDAFSAGLTVVDAATAEMCGQVIYPAAVLNVSNNVEAAQAFLDYCFTDEAMTVFESVGFSPVA